MKAASVLRLRQSLFVPPPAIVSQSPRSGFDMQYGQSRKRSLHGGRAVRTSPASTTLSNTHSQSSVTSTTPPGDATPPAPLSILPLSTLLRTYTLTAASSNPTLLSISQRILSFLAYTSNPVLSPERNPI